MIDVLTGFAVVGVAILTGYVVGRVDLLGPQGRFVLSRLCFFVLNPLLLFTVLAEADLGVLFSALLPVSALAAAAIFILYGLVARLGWRRGWGVTAVGALGAGYVNGNNIGIPIATYVLGDAAYAAPILLLQLLVFTPIVLAILDGSSSGEASFGAIARRTLRNPMIIGAALGVLVALLDVELPPIVMDPLRLLAGGAVPVLLISFGMSLYGQRVLTQVGTRRDIALATVCKLALMPLVAWAIGRFAFQLDDHALLAVVVLAALPSAQNVFNYAQRYEVGEVVARDTVFLTTLGCLPALFACALLLG
ncbi:membrane protein [Microbacterium barkeri]|uniref:Membrane protein n=1 Tax=Microbacterium barkeri TaxID=33917 RepID=A0A9W6H0K5_9MICO|nr:AEC family transporter [Microbacterium barkeri]MDR6876009.1 putative permease [Microbacterium barkeri]GLJ60126.1 membrane protein [Microbacterium barkeri]